MQRIKINKEHQYLLDMRTWYIDRYGYPVTDFWKNNKRKHVKLHKVLLWCPDGYQIDHINGNTLDNRLENLRIVTRAQNQWNSKISKNNKCGYKGVCWAKSKNKYKAEIMKHGKKYFLEHFDCPKEAHEAYKLKAVELHGEYARFE